MFLIVTSKQKKIQSRANSQIAGNSFAIPDLIQFLKIGCKFDEILSPEVDLFFISQVVQPQQQPQPQQEPQPKPQPKPQPQPQQHIFLESINQEPSYIGCK